MFPRDGLIMPGRREVDPKPERGVVQESSPLPSQPAPAPDMAPTLWRRRSSKPPSRIPCHHRFFRYQRTVRPRPSCRLSDGRHPNSRRMRPASRTRTEPVSQCCGEMRSPRTDSNSAVRRNPAPSRPRRGGAVYAAKRCGVLPKRQALAALGSPAAPPPAGCCTVTCSAVSAISSYQRSWCCLAQFTST